MGKVRVANLYLQANGKPGPALDFYDTPQPSTSDKPLISHLGYGQVSAYVSPRATSLPKYTTGANYANLYMFPAGSKKFGTKFDAVEAGSSISNAGWVAGAQATVVLSDGAVFGGTGQTMYFPEINEASPPKSSPGSFTVDLAKPPSGKGLLVTNTDGLNGWKSGGEAPIDLRVDGHCLDAMNEGPPGDIPAQGNGTFGNFGLSFGSHTLNIVGWRGPHTPLSRPQCQKGAALLE